ncbi:MAG: hypothetical protein AAFQ98_15115 [Bacteroidota bacterium]
MQHYRTQSWAVSLLLLAGCASYRGGIPQAEFLHYLTDNTQTVDLGQPFDFSMVAEKLPNPGLILVGEIHGFAEPQRFDLEFFSFLRREEGVRHYLLEMDYSQAYFMNRYNETGNDSLLDRVLQRWVVSQGRNNATYRSKWQAFHSLYQSGQHFQYLGISNLADLDLLAEHLYVLDPDRTFPYPSESADSVKAQALQQEIGHRLLHTGDTTVLSQYQHLKHSVACFLAKTPREEVLTANLRALYHQHHLKQHRIYAFVGLGHALLAPLQSGFQPMPFRLAQQDSWFQTHQFALNFLFVDSHMVVPSQGLPALIRQPGPYTRLPISYDNRWLSYLYGIQDLKQITPSHSRSLVHLRGTNSPYSKTQALFRMSQWLPMGQLIHAASGYTTTVYSHYLLFIRNSDWAHPYAPLSEWETPKGR